MKAYHFIQWTPDYCMRRPGMCRVYYRYKSGATLYALFGLHWILQLGVWIQHQWAKKAEAPSILEKWADVERGAK